MVEPDERNPANINNEIQSLRRDIDNLSKKQDISSIIQIKYWFIAYGIAILGIAVAVALRGEFDDVILLFLLGFLILGLFSIICSRQIATIELKRELRQAGFGMNQTQRRLNVPPTLKALATVAAWIMFILGCICLLVLIIYVIIFSFNPTSPNLSPIVITTLLALGIIYFLLSLIAMRIRRSLE